MPDVTKPAASSAEIDFAGATATLMFAGADALPDIGVEYLVSRPAIATEK